jgi:hypothetical protein
MAIRWRSSFRLKSHFACSHRDVNAKLTRPANGRVPDEPPSNLQYGPVPPALSELKLFLDRDGTHPVTSVVIASHYPRPASSFRHPDGIPVTARPEGRRVTPFLSNHYKCPGGGGCFFFFNIACVTASPTPVPRKSFKCNTCGHPRKCCKQKTYGIPKPFRCNTYKKQGVGSFIFPTFNVQTFQTIPKSHCAPQSPVPQ